MRDNYIDRFTSNWSEIARQNFRKSPMVIRHNYHEHQAFSDMALAALLERHPRDLIDFCTMGEDATDRDSWRAGDPGSLTGLELIETVRKGKLWINIRHAMDTDPEYQPIYNSMMADMRNADPSFKPLVAEAGILLSSPTAQVFLHSDVSETMLWHMRGVKRFRTYKPEAPYMDYKDIESVLLHEQTEDIPFDPAWDKDAFMVDLHPGMAANWPLHGPHRIENQSGMNVSVPFEISTPVSRQKNAILLANGILRRHFGMNPTSTDTEGFPAFAKRLLSGIYKAKVKFLGDGKKSMPKSETTFEIDTSAPDGFIDRKLA
jgi:hypothetical protein